MTTIIYKYQIPDEEKPISAEKRGPIGPSCELIDFKPRSIKPGDIIGRTIDEISPHIGTYGMGGPGFFGLKLGHEWLVIAVWGAGEWMTAKGRNVEDSFHENYGRFRPWLADWVEGESADELSGHLIGAKITYIDVTPRSLVIDFDNGFDLTIAEDSSDRPILEGSKEPRTFAKDDDLRKAVFLSPSAEIWV